MPDGGSNQDSIRKWGSWRMTMGLRVSLNTISEVINITWAPVTVSEMYSACMVPQVLHTIHYTMVGWNNLSRYHQHIWPPYYFVPSYLSTYSQYIVITITWLPWFTPQKVWTCLVWEFMFVKRLTWRQLGAVQKVAWSFYERETFIVFLKGLQEFITWTIPSSKALTRTTDLFPKIGVSLYYT